MKTDSLSALVDRFSGRKVLVVGDIMVDKFIWGSVSRISPEAPVPVVEVKEETRTPGGAANVAMNLRALGAEVRLIGLIGKDPAGKDLLSLLHSARVQTEGVLEDKRHPTALKTRIIAHHQQVVRVDWEHKAALDASLENALRRNLEKGIPAVDAVILSDYGKRVISPGVLSAAVRLAKRHRKPVTVDPKVENFKRYKGVTCITPNTQEALRGMGVHAVSSEREMGALARDIRKTLNCKTVLITRGEKGMTICEGNRILNIPATAKEVFDVTGAGDTVISVYTLALAAGASSRSAATLANYAAGIVVGKLGTATASPAEIKAVLSHHARVGRN